METTRKLVALVIGFVFAASSPSAGATQLSDRDIERLNAGKTVKQPYAHSRQNGYYGGMGWVIIDAPANIVWSALHDWNSYPEFFPRTVSAKELYQQGQKSIVRMEIGYRILNLEYSLNVNRNTDKHIISFELDQNRPHDLEDSEGYWRLFPRSDGRTLVVYAISVRVPRWISIFLGERIEKKLERNLIGLPEYLKKWVEGPEGNRYRRMTAKR